MHDYVWLLVPKMSSFKSKTSRKGFMQIVNSASFAKVKKKAAKAGAKVAAKETWESTVNRVIPSLPISMTSIFRGVSFPYWYNSMVYPCPDSYSWSLLNFGKLTKMQEITSSYSWLDPILAKKRNTSELWLLFWLYILVSYIYTYISWWYIHIIIIIITTVLLLLLLLLLLYIYPGDIIHTIYIYILQYISMISPWVARSLVALWNDAIFRCTGIPVIRPQVLRGTSLMVRCSVDAHSIADSKWNRDYPLVKLGKNWGKTGEKLGKPGKMMGTTKKMMIYPLVNIQKNMESHNV